MKVKRRYYDIIMYMKPDEFAAFLRSGALNAAPTTTPYHKQEDAADET